VAEVFREFESAIVARDGTTYVARVCGGEARDGTTRWHAWIEFVDRNSGNAIRTQRETTQRNRIDTAYWADGLTPAYLDGALRRALNPNVIRIRQSRQLKPAFDAPGPDRISGEDSSSATTVPKAGRMVPQPTPMAPSPTGFASVGGMHSLKEQLTNCRDDPSSPGPRALVRHRPQWHSPVRAAWVRQDLHCASDGRRIRPSVFARASRERGEQVCRRRA
jgi:hypothetical protein